MLRAAFIFILLLVPTVAHAEKRVALVIGNSTYKHAGELANPKNDATDMAAALKKLSFQVIEGYDLEKAALDRKIRDFATTLQGADVGLFFYAGHGLQVAGQNYIVPVDAELTTAASLDFEMVRLDLVHRTMEREAPTNIIFLDACRNNPLARNLARALGTRSTDVGRGLATVESGSGTLISFSTQPGNVASDGSGRNSPFTGPLVKHITNSNDDLSAVLIAVRNDVMNATQQKQVPWEHSALTKRIYFNAMPDAAKPATGTPTGSLSEAAQTWGLVKDTASQSVLEAFAKQFSDTVYGAMARARLEELKKKQVAVATTSPAALKPSPPSPASEQSQSPVNERNFKLGSSFPKSMTETFEPSEQFAKQVLSASSGRLKIQVFAGGEIVPGLQVLESVVSGTIDLGWTFAFYYFARDPTFAFIGGSMPLGIDASTFVRWLEGPGKTVRAEVYAQAGVKALPCSIGGPKGLWLRREVRSLKDLNGLKLRIGGTTTLSLQATGIVAQQLAAGEINQALEKGAIDGLEWYTPPMDEKMGWHKSAKYYYYPFGEPTFSAVADLLVNKKVWDELEPTARDVVESACRRQLHNDLGKLSNGAAAAMERMRAGGTVIGQVPEPIATAYRKGAEFFLDQSIKSPAGLAVWQSLKAMR